MKRIYTKTGDEGMTSLRGGVRVPKDDLRIETNGVIDELNAVIGICRSLMQPDEAEQELLRTIQQELMTIMSHVATPEGKTNPRVLQVSELTERLEQEIDQIQTQIDPQKYFILPGGTPLSAHLHFARTITRTAERRLWSLSQEIELDLAILRFMNRLSDYFFMFARAEMYRKGCADEPFIR